MRSVALAVLCSCATQLAFADKLLIISPHRQSIKNEFVPAFKAHYEKTYQAKVDVEWLDQGGTSSAVRYVHAKFSKNPDSAGIDVFWGGTSANFVDMADAGVLANYALPKALKADFPDSCAGVQLSDSKDRWHASALSSFGVVYNRRLLQMKKIPEPKTWADLGTAPYHQQVMLADPRKSGTNSTMHMIVMNSQGWDKGWASLMSIAGNTRMYTHSSSDPVKAVVAGDASAAMVIDFYGLAKIWELGEENLGFMLPDGQTILDPDPVAILKGAPNALVAKRFVNYLLSEEAQKLWVLPKGKKGGPRFSNLARMSVLPNVYKATDGDRLYSMNPFEQRAFLKVDLEAAGKTRRAFNDLIGTVFVDAHRDLKEAWSAILKRGDEKAIASFTKPLVSEVEFLTAAKTWSDNVARNRMINEWTRRAQAHYRSAASAH